MGAEDIDRWLLSGHSSKHRPIIWKTVGRFAIEPPEPFYQIQVLGLIRGEVGQDSPIAPSTLHREMMVLGKLGMVERVDPSFRGPGPKWLIRTGPEAWDQAYRVMQAQADG